MAIRPPQGNSGSPDAVEFGIAALNARLDEAGVTFPATTEEVLAAVDETAVPYDASGNTLELEEAIANLPQDRFGSESELLDQLHPVFEARRERAANSVIGRIRALLPF
ncbi:hypothetical protein [Halorarum salinum]|uniref:DUF2795 domain-containing protein n=1 Tax=Halorarum salinum TaxID=2743089 RepID=A0A7D5QI59_9EURY|nr:hypothetical protein [Halobaculum salinum]QLG63423.1 hypothetical protein HUG12_17470 [Halobaculum salinum]